MLFRSQLTNDNYQMFSKKFRKQTLSQIVDIIISQTSGCGYTCHHLVYASIQIRKYPSDSHDQCINLNITLYKLETHSFKLSTFSGS